MHPLPRTCPACGHKFVPWQVWRITRWTNIACPSCHAALNRRLDAQLFLVGTAALVVMALASFWLPLNLATGAAIYCLCLGLAVVLDALTVRLVRAGAFRGIRGYKTEL